MLPVSDPLNNLAIPPDPVVTVGEPDTKILPPVVVPMAALFPAFKTTAELVVEEVAKFPSKVKSPDWVEICTSPVDVIGPNVKAFAST